MEPYLPYVWLAVAIFMGLVEMSTSQLVSVWFVLGAIAAAISCIFTDDIVIQLVIFIAVSLISLIVTRPIVKKIRTVPPTATNIDMYIGKSVIVLQDINNDIESGEVKVDGVTWTARTEKGQNIEKGQKVVIKAIQGSKLIVEPLSK